MERKTLVVYYSYSGNNKLLAEYISKEIKADLCPIVETKKRSGVTIFLDIFLKRSPQIENFEKNINDYQHVIFLAPLWAGKIASPLRTLLKQKKDSIQNYSFVTLCGGYESKDQMEEVKKELQGLTGKMPIGLYELDVSDLIPKEKRKEIKAVSGYHVRPEDLTTYRDQLQKMAQIFSHEPHFVDKSFDDKFDF